eukprot:306176-Hanusia_phi.AAC.2
MVEKSMRLRMSGSRGPSACARVIMPNCNEIRREAQACDVAQVCDVEDGECNDEREKKNDRSAQRQWR